MNAEIQDWFKSKKDYDKGLDLYFKYGRNKVLTRVLTKGPTKYNVIKLESELGKLMKKTEAKGYKAEKGQSTVVILDPSSPGKKTASASVPGFDTKKFDPSDKEFKAYSESMKQDIPFDDLPEAMKEKRMMRLDLMKKRNAAHAELVKMVPAHIEAKGTKLDELQGQANELCSFIVQASDTIRDLYQEEEFYSQNGYIMPREKPKKDYESMKPHELVKERGNLRSSVTRKKNRVKKLGDQIKEMKNQHEIDKVQKKRDKTAGLLDRDTRDLSLVEKLIKDVEEKG